MALGLMETVEIGSLSSEYDIRNSLSRLYYAFFHASLAILLTKEPDIKGFLGTTESFMREFKADSERR